MKSIEVQRMIGHIAKLPGLGLRSARRIGLHLLKHKEKALDPLIHVLQEAASRVQSCPICYNLDTTAPCSICADVKRQNGQLCVVEDVVDLWALERAQVFQGHYHVLGGVLSAIQGVGPQQLSLNALAHRVAGADVQEVILALNTTLDSQTTSFYILDNLRAYGKPVSRLAYGLPLGGELDYMDEGTLVTAFKSRHPLD